MPRSRYAAGSLLDRWVLLASIVTQVAVVLLDRVPVRIALRSAYVATGQLQGIDVGEDVLKRIFSRFCVGK